MKYRNVLISITILFLSGFSGSLSAAGCRGEGPTPLSPHDYFPKFKWLEAGMGAQDFNLWEESNKLVFRTYGNELREYSLTSGLFTGLTPMDRRMANITEPQNRYVVTEGRNIAFDSHTNTWKEFEGAKQPLRHLFWSGNDLYTFHRNKPASGKHQLEVYRYHYGDSSATKVCSLQIDKYMRIAEGFHFPYLRLFSVWEGAFGKQTLRTYRVDVTRNCDWVEESPGWIIYPGKIQELYNFNQDNSYAVKVNSSYANLLWMQGNRCTVHNLSGQQPMVLDYRNPTVATWTPKAGLEVVSLQQKKVSRLIQDWQVVEFTPRDIRMTMRQDKLFLSPLLMGDTQRRLVQVDIKN